MPIGASRTGRLTAAPYPFVHVLLVIAVIVVILHFLGIGRGRTV